jgi:hypothetical protein
MGGAMKWEVKRDGVVIAHGESERSQPSQEEVRRFRSDGYRVYVGGKEVKK